MRRAPLVFSILLLGFSHAARPAQAQQASEPDPVDVLATVITHRIQTRDDGTPFSGCLMSGLLRGLDLLVASLGPLADRAFGDPENPCPGPIGDRVELVSIGLGATISRVRLRIFEGEGVRGEEYTLTAPPILIEGAPRWVVGDVRELAR